MHNQKPSYGTKHITNIIYIKQDLSTHIKQDKRSLAFYGPPFVNSRAFTIVAFLMQGLI